MGLAEILAAKKAAAAQAEKAEVKVEIKEKAAVKTQVVETEEDQEGGISLSVLDQAITAASQVEDVEFTAIPDGKYDAEIKEVKFSKSKTHDQNTGEVLLDSKGKPKIARDMFSIELDVLVGDSLQKEWIYYVFGGTEDWAASNAKRMLTIMERFGVDVTTSTTINKTFEKMIGKEVKLTIVTKKSATTGKLNRNTKLEKK